MSGHGGRPRSVHPHPSAAPVWAALLNAPRDEWHRPDLTYTQVYGLHTWQARGWLEMRLTVDGRGHHNEVRLTLNGRVWTRQWLGDDA
jgi:hypothetical protein